MLWRSVFVTHLLVILVLGSFAWGARDGLSIGLRRAEAFNVLVFGEIGYCVTTRYIKTSTFHVRALVSDCCLLIVLVGSSTGGSELWGATTGAAMLCLQVDLGPHRRGSSAGCSLWLIAFVTADQGHAAT